jgi:hypothetical protein
MPPINPNVDAGRNMLAQSLMGQQQPGAGTAMPNPPLAGGPPAGNPFAAQMGPQPMGGMQPAAPMGPTPRFDLSRLRNMNTSPFTTTGANILGNNPRPPMGGPMGAPPPAGMGTPPMGAPGTPGMAGPPPPMGGGASPFAGGRNPLAGMFGRR